MMRIAARVTCVANPYCRPSVAGYAIGRRLFSSYYQSATVATAATTAQRRNRPVRETRRPIAQRETERPIVRQQSDKKLIKLNPRYNTIEQQSDKKPIKINPPQNTSELFVALSELNNYGIKLPSFPAVAVIGPQSSGKSSVIEAICGKSILPKGMGMVTMKPIHLTTIRSDKTEFKVGTRTVNDEKSARNELERLNMNSYITKIDVTIKDPDVYNSFLVDLPGLFNVSDEDKPDLKKEVKDLNRQYVENPNIIPLIVTSATQDPATNGAIQMIRKYKREHDTFGIITKTDLVEGQSLDNVQGLLSNKNYQLGHGYISVVRRNKKEEERGYWINRSSN